MLEQRVDQAEGQVLQDHPPSTAEEARRLAKSVDLADLAFDVDASVTSDARPASASRALASEVARHVSEAATANAAVGHAIGRLELHADARTHLGSTMGLASQQALREVLEGGAADRLNAVAGGQTLIDRALREATFGSVVDQTMRDVLEAQTTMTDVLHRHARTGSRSSGTRRIEEDTIAALGFGPTTSAGLVAEAMASSYARVGLDSRHDRLFGHAASIGSLAPIASGILNQAGGMAARTDAMLLDLEQRNRIGVGRNSIDAALRSKYGDIFGTMRSPRPSEIEAVIAGMTSMAAFKPYPDWETEARARVGALEMPWIRADTSDASIVAMARLTELDLLVMRFAPEDRHLNVLLRDRLGDYDSTEPPKPEVLADPVARTGYQLGCGLDPTLSLLPTAIVAAVFAPFGQGAANTPVDPDQLENAVRMLLKRLETALRRFIVAKLESLHGPGWFDALPSEIRRAWTNARQREVDAGRTPGELVEYADIEDYLRIIEHPERWPRLFEPVFRDKGQIRATLRRIAVIRNPGAHFRTVTVEDLLILRAEGVHLARWLNVRLGD